jgi:ABC-type multidrug transport system permease subunit
MINLVVTVILMGVAGNTIGFFIGSFFKDAGRAASLGPVALLPLMMFSGIYNKINDIPAWIAWMQYISPFRYGLQMILVNQYEDLVIHIES